MAFRTHPTRRGKHETGGIGALCMPYGEPGIIFVKGCAANRNSGVPRSQAVIESSRIDRRYPFRIAATVRDAPVKCHCKFDTHPRTPVSDPEKEILIDPGRFFFTRAFGDVNSASAKLANSPSLYKGVGVFDRYAYPAYAWAVFQ